MTTTQVVIVVIINNEDMLERFHVVHSGQR